MKSEQHNIGMTKSYPICKYILRHSGIDRNDLLADTKREQHDSCSLFVLNSINR
jgi:hypothetical protein